MKIVTKDGTELKKMILKSGYSLKSFGEFVGISESQTHNVLGRKPTSPASAKKIADTLGVSFDDIFFIVEEGKVQI